MVVFHLETDVVGVINAVIKGVVNVADCEGFSRESELIELNIYIFKFKKYVYTFYFALLRFQEKTILVVLLSK